MRRNNTSKHKNISWDKEKKKWRVMIMTNGKYTRYGRFEDIKDAFNKRDEVIIELNKQGHHYITELPKS